MSEKEITIEMKGIIGAQTPFWQGGSFRIILPKWFVSRYGKKTDLDQIPFIFVETDKGVLIRPIREFISDSSMRDKLGFLRPSRIDESEIAKLINKKCEEDENVT